MKNDNRGMSIIEIVIILAMMAVLLGFMTNIVGYLSGKQARECAYKIDASLAGIRMDTMSKSTGGNDVFLTLEKIANPPFCMYVIRLTRILFNLFTQPSHVYVNGSHIARILIAPHNV